MKNPLASSKTFISELRKSPILQNKSRNHFILTNFIKKGLWRFWFREIFIAAPSPYLPATEICAGGPEARPEFRSEKPRAHCALVRR